MSKWKYNYGASIIKAGGVVAYPTEAVYGLGCDPFNYQAVKELLRLKQRSVSKGLLVLVSDKKKLLELLKERLSQAQFDELEREWPGPKTYLLPLNDFFPLWISGSHDSVAIRVSDHPVASALTKACGGFLVSTSANISGHQPATNILQLRRVFQDQLDFLIGGETGLESKPTPIKNILTGETIRP